MNDSEKYPKDRVVQNIDDDFDDDFDVPTYRKLAEPANDGADGSDSTATRAFPGVPESDSQSVPELDSQSAPRQRYDAYAAAGRVAPQVIQPNSEPAPNPAAEPAATEVFEEPAPEDTQVEQLADGTDLPVAPAAETEIVERPDFAETEFAAAPEARQTTVEEDDFIDEDEPEYRRGTTDFGLLLVRLGLGCLLLIHGLTTLLGWGGSDGITALQTQFERHHFALAGVMAVAIPTVQLIAATLLILGLATPLGAALALVVSAYFSMFDVATADSVAIVGDNASDLQLQLLMTVVALGLQFTGPGQIGVDFSRGWARRPLASSWIFAVLAACAVIALWWFTTGSIPMVHNS